MLSHLFKMINSKHILPHGSLCAKQRAGTADHVRMENVFNEV